MYPIPTSANVWSFVRMDGTASKNRRASSTVISRISATFLPL